MTNSRIRALALAAALLCGAASSLAAPPKKTSPAPAPKPGASPPADVNLLTLDLGTILDRLEKAQGEAKTLTANFVQRKRVSLLGDVQESSGRLYYTQPDRVLWFHEKPDERVLCINGDTFTNWYKDLKRATVVDISKQRRRVFKYFAIGEKMSVLRENFVVTVAPKSDLPDTVRLELVPRRQRVRDRLEKMDMWISTSLWLPVQVRYSEPGGDYTQFALSNLKPNAVVPDATYSFEIPPDVKVDRTMSGEPDSVPGRTVSR